MTRIALLAAAIMLIAGCGRKIEVERKTKPFSIKYRNQESKLHLEEDAQAAYQTGGPNPFLGGPPAATAESTGAATTTVAGVSAQATAQPTNLPHIVEAPRTQPLQLPTLPSQEVPDIPTVEVPQWSTQSPILSMGPPARWKNLVNLALTGVVISKDKKMKRAVIEEILLESTSTARGAVSQRIGQAQTTQTTTAATTGQTGISGGTLGFFPRRRSYVVQEGEVFSEWRFLVVKINPKSVVLRKNAERIVLPLATVKRQEKFILPGGQGNLLVPGSLPSDTIRSFGPGGKNISNLGTGTAQTATR